MMGARLFTVLLMMAGIVGLAGCATPLKPYGPGPNDPKAEKIVIEKSARRLTLYKEGKPWKEYRVALGKGGLAAKEREGDARTPEGLYFIKNRNPQSIYYKALRISYPNETDVIRARQLGVKPGKDIMIHGLSKETRPYGPAHTRWDWTEGCVAVTDGEIEEIWNSVADGTLVEIRS